jgi:hypothetical protein
VTIARLAKALLAKAMTTGRPRGERAEKAAEKEGFHNAAAHKVPGAAHGWTGRGANFYRGKPPTGQPKGFVFGRNG